MITKKKTKQKLLMESVTRLIWLLSKPCCKLQISIFHNQFIVNEHPSQQIKINPFLSLRCNDFLLGLFNVQNWPSLKYFANQEICHQSFVSSPLKVTLKFSPFPFRCLYLKMTTASMNNLYFSLSLEFVTLFEHRKPLSTETR